MSLALAVTSMPITRRQKSLKMLATPSGSYPTGGEPILLSQVTNPKFIQGATIGRIPKGIDIFKYPGGYAAEIVAGAGTSIDTAFLLKIYSAPGTELAAGAYPAAISGDNFTLQTFDDLWAS